MLVTPLDPKDRRRYSANVAGRATRQGLRFLVQMFGAGPEAVGCQMAARAEEGVGDE
ncbi:MAG: hypothetical protein ACM30G_19205 [Micromonosporaceae bacterium]